jgi:hypothetical protein
MSKRPVAIGDNDKDPRYCKFDWAKCDQRRVYTSQQLTLDTQYQSRNVYQVTHVYILFFFYTSSWLNAVKGNCVLA